MKKLFLIFIILLFSIISVNGALTDGLISYYNFDNSDAIDSLGTNNGTVNGPRSTSGYINNGYEFNDTEDYIDFPNPFTWSETQSFTVGNWLKYNGNLTDVVSNIWIWNTNDVGISNRFHVRCQGFEGGVAENLRCRVDQEGVASYVRVFPNVTLDSWVYMIFMFNATSNAQAYLNETLEDDNSVTDKSGSDSTEGWRFGADEDQAGYGISANMTIDEVAIWNRLLTPSEISELYNNGSGLQYPFIVDLTFSNWNMTSDGGCTVWNTNQSTECNTTDSTPTVTVDTSIPVSCRIGTTDSNYTAFGGTRNCSTTGSTSHICTVIAGDTIPSGSSNLYISCDENGNATSSSGALAINLNQAPNDPTLNAPENGSIDQILYQLLNITVTDNDDDSMNVTFYNINTTETCVNTSNIANGSDATCRFSLINFNYTYFWYANVTDGILTTQSDTWNFTTKEKVLTGNMTYGNEIIVSGGTVYIIKQDDDSLAGTATSNASGGWTYSLSTNGTYLVCGYDPANQTLRGDIASHINAIS